MLPFLNVTKQHSKKYVVQFSGLNRSEEYTDGEFSDMQNISTEAFPCISQRYAREEQEPRYQSAQAIYVKDGLLAIDGANVLFNGTQVFETKDSEVTENALTVETDGKRKQMAAVGNYVMIFPDKKFVEIVDGKVESAGSMEVKIEGVRVTFTSDSIQAVKVSEGMSGLKFTANTIEVPEGTATSPWNGLGIDPGDKITISGCTDQTANNKVAEVKEVADLVLTFTDKTFTAMAEETGEVTIICGDKGFKWDQWDLSKGDSVTISPSTDEEESEQGENEPSFEHSENQKTEELVIQEEVTGNTLTFMANKFTANSLGTTETIDVCRTVPDLDFLCESNNRLWGVKGNTIYGSKFRDPKNFKSLGGTAGDSYAMEVGSEGEFTGCINYSTHICFFKENTLHKLYGSKPANFQIVTTQVYGVQAGSERSLCVINETIFYKGVNGVYAYTGSIPELISKNLGTVRTPVCTCAATDGHRYYLCLSDKDKEKSDLYVYDTLHGLWVREDDLKCVDMAFYDGYVHFLTEKKLLKIDPDAKRSDVEWSATFCPFYETMNERKGYSKFHMRLELGDNAWLNVEIKRNTDTKWQKVYTTHNERAKTISVPIFPARCDSVEVRLCGKGECKLRTFVREFFVGSDV